MPVETANYITDLVPANPLHTDGLGQADSHLRMIKQVLQNQFPNLGDIAVTATATQLNGVSSALAPGVVTVNPDPTSSSQGGQAVLGGVTSIGAPSVSITNVGTGGFQITIGGLLVASCNAAGAWSFPASVTAGSIQQTGNQIMPSGAIVMWSGAINAIPGGWLLCNGSNGTPDLRDRFIVGSGNSYTVGQTGGAASVQTDNQGTHGHGGDTGLAGYAVLTGVTDQQGLHSHGGGVGGWSLTGDELPPHTHGISCATSPGGGSGLAYAVGGSPGYDYPSDSAGSGNPHSHTISLDGYHAHNLSISSVPAHQHTISLDGGHVHNVATVPPFYSLAYIMKQ